MHELIESEMLPFIANDFHAKNGRFKHLNAHSF